MAEFSVGQVVISRKGKDAGVKYVVSGLDGSRARLIRPPRFNTTHPKAKNPKHLQGTCATVIELVSKLEAGQDIDAGQFHRSVRS